MTAVARAPEMPAPASPAADIKTDRITLQTFADHCIAAVEAMAFTLMRTAHSTFVKETEDFTCALLTPEGATFACPRTMGTTWLFGLDYGPAIKMIASYEEGDVCITNDPYSGSVATHTPDIHIWKPIFIEGELVCFVAGHIHNTDIGGAVPASLSRTLTEIQQEGICIPPSKLVSRGVLNEDIVKILRANVRVPKQNWGDLNAQIASVAIGERKIKDVIARFGLPQFKQGIEDMLSYAHAKAQEVVRTIPDGQYFHAEYADEDSDGGLPCRIAITLTIKDGSLILDYTGSDPQLTSSLNIPTGGREQHALTMVGLGYVLYTLDKTLLMNSGVYRVGRAILPRGSVVHAVAPAAVGMRSLTCIVTQLGTFGAFAKAIPERLGASPAGGNALMFVRTLDTEGRTIMASVGPLGGGAGGGPSADGTDGAGASSAYLKNTPIEISESEIPIRFKEYGLAPDSGGAGLWRGGAGLVMEFEVFAPHTIITARNRDRSMYGCWGLKGGYAGALSSFILNPQSPEAKQLGNRDVVTLQPGDVIRTIGPGAGGWGDPLDRDPDQVALDVAGGLVSAEQARAAYGVVLSGETVDLPATRALRAQSRKKRPLFDYGPTRTAYEAVWNEERYRALTRVLTHTAITWRHWVKIQVFAAVAAGRHADAGETEQISRIYEELTQRFPRLRTIEPSAL
ncbi:MAG: hydantoinase B/oxoprolinase family protein [Hyphomicrobiaceae bacterium]